MTRNFNTYTKHFHIQNTHVTEKGERDMERKERRKRGRRI
jgi:hypothetical protein